ncbi:MAG: ParA family protein, partial [Angelakisella sp.]
MRTIGIVNLKGGVGKTVTAINFAAILACDHKKRVLLIDADSQGNTTEFFGVDPREGNLAQLLRYAPADTFESFVRHTSVSRLDLLAASDDLMDLDLSKVEAKLVNTSIICDIAVLAAENDSYDYIIIDCPPAFNAASAAALLGSDDVIIPIKLVAF